MVIVFYYDDVIELKVVSMMNIVGWKYDFGYILYDDYIITFGGYSL